MPVDTTQNWLFDEAPVKVSLKGDKKRKVESSTHIIEFPGGAIELSRLDNGDYWAHIIVNRDWANNDVDGLENSYGEIVDSRIDYVHPIDPPVTPVLAAKDIRQVAIRIRPSRTE